MATRAEYNECVSAGLKGKKFTPEARRTEFCVVAKLCSGKASSRDEAERMCEESLSQPREPKTRVSAGPSTGKVRMLPTASGVLIKKGRTKIELSQDDYRKLCPCQFEE